VEAPAPPRPAEGPAAGDPFKEAERLLGQGEVASACKKAEEARRAAPARPAIYKLLGKCYMRAGAHERANENYRKYLELAPEASDAAFIESIVK
jgi:Flp pilus assembly protein TadD